MRLLTIIFKRQLVSFASSPSTYLSVAVFLVLGATLGLHSHHWLEQNSSDLQAFFELHPWLYLLLVPILSTQLWSDESNTGFCDTLKSLPVTPTQRVVGKFMAAWIVCGIALMLNFPLVMAVNYLGTPDNTVIASQFFASWLLAGSYLSVGCFACVLTNQRVMISLLTLCLLLAASGISSMLDALEQQTPIWIIDSLLSLDPISRFSAIDNGKLTLHDCLYFISMILAFLFATTFTLNYRNS